LVFFFTATVLVSTDFFFSASLQDDNAIAKTKAKLRKILKLSL
jgi:hypothetical protein